MSFYDIVKRKILRKEESDIDSQPRKITRMLCMMTKQKDLSPLRRGIIRADRSIIINREIEDEQRHDVKGYFELLWNWSYTIFVFTVLCLQPMYTLSIVVSNRTADDIQYLAGLFFQLIPPTQYYHAVKYFRTDHFEEFYYSSAIIPKLNHISGVIVFLTGANMIFNSIRLFMTDYDGEFPGYNEYSLLGRCFIFFFLLISWLYSNLILFTNLSCFFLIFTKHTNILKEYSNEILAENCISTINEMTVSLFRIIYDLKTSIGNFESMFSSFTFLGAISFGMFLSRIKQGDLTFFPWNLFVTYIVIQVIFFWVILSMNGCRNRLSDSITHPKYAKKYIKRYSVDEIKTHFENEDEQFLLLINMEEELGGIVDWQLFNDLLDKDWTEFKFFGINIADFELIKRGTALVVIILGINAIINGEQLQN